MPPNRRSRCGSQTRAPSESSVTSEIFGATHATEFPSPVGAAYSVGRAATRAGSSVASIHRIPLLAELKICLILAATTMSRLTALRFRPARDNWKLASYEVAGNTPDNLSRPEGTLEIRRAVRHGNISPQ
jgi:hypothetical protein